MDERSPADPSPAAATRRLLDEAARAYMDGDYDAAQSAWQRVLGVDPDNPRAREGLKKVSMLHAEDGSEEAVSSPVLAEVERHLEQRRFDAAVQLCREKSESAGPALAAALRRLQERAERARAVEPEIQHAMAQARRSLQEGKLREAIPQLKRVLALDGEHPVARRLMDGIRERARKRTGDAIPGMTGEGGLPASGRPGSDAREAEPAGMGSKGAPEEPPAPPGKGLPSSPVEADGEIVPEIELEMISLEPGVGAAGDLPPGGDDDEVVAEMPEPIQLTGGPETTGHRFAQTSVEPDAPFASDETLGDEAAARPRPGPRNEHAQEAPGRPTRPMAGAGAAQEQPVGRRPRPAAGADGGPDPETRTPPRGLPPPPPRGRRGKGVPLLLTAILLVTAGGVGAWSMGWLTPFLPAAQPLEVARPTAPVEEPGVDASQPAADGTVPRTGADRDSGTAGDGAGGRAAAAGATPAGGAMAAGREPSPTSEPSAPKPDPRAALALFESGQDLFEAGRFEEASAAFRQAILLDPVNADIASWQARAEARLQERRRMEAETASAVAAFHDKDFETALRKFYRLQEKGTAGSFERSIINSWYNWGLQLLAGGNLREADRKMDEVLAIQPDEDAVAVKKLIQEYQNRAKDRVFYVRVEALRYRPIDA